MVAFFGSIALTSTLNIGILGLLIPMVWFYSFFDGINKASSMPYENIEEHDKSIFDNIFKGNIFPTPKWGLSVGVALIVFGAYLLADRIIIKELEALGLIDMSLIRKYFSTAVLSLVFILVGVRLVRGSKIQKKDDC